RALPDSLEQLQGLLDVFAHWYDTDRPHRALNRRTPSQAYTALPKATPKTTAEPEYRTRTDKCL
ncbi:MAG: integrase core domain-containing protein, partial [Yaniella sp.]